MPKCKETFFLNEKDVAVAKSEISIGKINRKRQRIRGADYFSIQFTLALLSRVFPYLI